MVNVYDFLMQNTTVVYMKCCVEWTIKLLSVSAHASLIIKDSRDVITYFRVHILPVVMTHQLGIILKTFMKQDFFFSNYDFFSNLSLC